MAWNRNARTWRRVSLVDRDGERCAYCGKTDEKLTIDHLIPKSVGGSNGLENLVLACDACNQDKRSLTVWQFVTQFEGRDLPEYIIRRIGAEAAFGLMELTE